MGMIGFNKALLHAFPIEVVQEHETGEQVRRHRKKRINKKWLKRYGTHWEMLDPGQIIFVNGKLLMSRRTYNKLKMESCI